jgi:hypothetical protein
MTTPAHVEIDLKRQRLRLIRAGRVVGDYAVSTAKNGAGEIIDSECTPRGRHVIDEKIGDGCVENTIFVGRTPGGELYGPILAAKFPQRDWILTRILWLRGLEPGRNVDGDVDTKARYIYIHGTPAETDMSRPGSHGCIRMRNQDVIDLFEQVPVGTEVMIRD